MIVPFASASPARFLLPVDILTRMKNVPTSGSAAEVLAEGPFDLAQVQIRWNPLPLPMPPAVAAFIEERWQYYLAQARAQKRDLFNGPMTAVAGFTAAAGGVIVDLRPSDYKSFVVTCLRDRPWFQKNAPEFITVAPGNTALLTCGEQAYLGLRSARVSTYPGRVHAFGGALDLDLDHPPARVEALLAHIEKEVFEELGLTPAALAAPPRLLGVYRDAALWQPEFVWQWELGRPPSQVHPHEHDGLVAVGRQVGEDESRLTPVAAGAVRSWRGGDVTR